MTDYDDPSSVMHNIEESYHHHGSSDRHHHAHWAHWPERHSGKIACVAILVALILFVVIFGFYWALSNEVHSHVHTHSMDVEMLKARGNPFASHALYSLSGLGQTGEYRVNLCRSALYRPHNETAGAMVTLWSVPDDDLAQLVLLRPYALQVRLNVRYNVARAALGTVASGSKDDRYVVTRFELASSFAGFSTIRLVESAVDIYKRTVRKTRALTLCSDDPSSSAGPCRRHVTPDGTMVVNNTYEAPMDQPSSRRPAANSSKFGPASSHDDGGDSRDVSVTYGRADLRAMEDDIAHIRLYHLLFYSEYGRGVHDASPSDTDSDYNGDYLVLSMQAKPC